MTIGKLWAGKIFGTNTGNLFVKLAGDDDGLTGTAHYADQQFGLVVYTINGSFDGSTLVFEGGPEGSTRESVSYGKLTAKADLNARGELQGEWSTDIGTAGTFVLFPHDQEHQSVSESETSQEQLHSVKHYFGAVIADRDQIIRLADDLQVEFKNAQVVVTVVAGTEQSRLLKDFKAMRFNGGKASVIKIFAQERETNGINRIVLIEFGPDVNLAMTQGADEAWVLGMLEKLKNSVRPLERFYATNFKRVGFGTSFGINQVLLVGAIVFLPSLGTTRDRALLMVGILAIIWVVNWLHRRYLPLANLYLGTRPRFASWLAPSILSWVIATTSAAAAALLAAYLQGWLPSL